MAECNNCIHMKRENSQLRKNRDEIHKNYLQIINENLELRRQLEEASKRLGYWDHA